MTRQLLLATALAATFVAAPAFAQDSTATLRIDSGSAMVSTGGEFTTAVSGAQVEAGNRVMLTEGSRATLVYSGGCTQALTTAGVYSVPSTCRSSAGAAGATAGTGTGTAAGAVGVDMGGLGIVTGIAVAGAAALASMDEVPYVEPPPVSR